MILVDANLLIYAYVIGMRQHAAAQEWLDGRLNDGATRVGLPWNSLLAFVRLTASPKIFGARSTVTAAWEQVERWLELDSVWIPTPTELHRQILSRLLAETSERADLVNDAHLAALAIEHGLTLCSADRDFSRFSGLRWENPLEQ